MENKLDHDLTDRDGAGVYAFTGDAGVVARRAADCNLDVLTIDCPKAGGKSDLLRAIAAALQLPAHFGNNWDALNDCLTDLDSEAAGWLLIFTGGGDFAAGHPDDHATLVAVLRGATDYWRAEKKSFWAVFITAADAALGLPPL